jgi:uncharacterized lipoprotein YbaY
MMRLRTLGAAVLLVLVAATFGPLPSAAVAQSGERCFSETGFCISGRIREFWEQNGGLAVFGLPLGPQQEVTDAGGRTVQAQWFERHRLELHPENPAPYDVLLGRLGADRLAQLGRPWQPGGASDESGAGDAERCRLFAETGRVVCDEFLAAWRRYGLSFPGVRGTSFEESLALFGLPLTDATTETIDGKEYTVQWFERARFELHPENQPPFNVLFGRLGAELGGGSNDQAAPAPASDGQALVAGGEWTLVSFGTTTAAESAGTARPATIAFDGARVTGFGGCNRFNGPYQATGDAITFGPLVSTRAACTTDALNRQENTVFAVLQGTARYTIDGNTLSITAADGKELTYRAAARTAVTGTVTYRQRSALPPQAVIEVKLLDVSRADAPAIEIASQTIQANGRQVPFAFELPYDPAQIDPRFNYAVQARITVDGQLKFITTERFAVITQGNPTNVEVVVQPV